MEIHTDDPVDVVRDIEVLARTGSPERAACEVARVPVDRDGDLSDLLARLRADGFEEEAATIDLVRREPEVSCYLQAVTASSVACGLVAAVVFHRAGIVAAMVGVAAGLLAGELVRRLARPPVRERLAPDDRRRLDQLARGPGAVPPGWMGVLIHPAGLAALGGALAVAWVAGDRLPAGPTTGWAALAVVLSGVSVGAWNQRRRRRFGWRHPDEVQSLAADGRRGADGDPWFASDSDTAAIPVRTTTVARPRLTRSLLLAAPWGFAAFALVTDGSGWWILVGVGCGAMAVWLVTRGWRTAVEIGPDGIRDRGLVRTRSWTWDQVHTARVTTLDKPDDLHPALVLVTADGVERRLVELGAGGSSVRGEAQRRTNRHREAELIDLASTIERAGRAPEPGPPRRAVAGAVAAMAGVAFVGMIVALFLIVVFFGHDTATVDPSAMAPGERYLVYEHADGTRSEPKVECPSPFQRLQGAPHPYCPAEMTGQYVFSAILLVGEFVVVAIMIAIGRSAWRLGRHRRSHRAPPPGPSVPIAT